MTMRPPGAEQIEGPNGLRFSMRTVGHGDAVVLMIPGGPGFPAASMMLDAMLIADHYQVVMIDPPGTGDTPNPSSPDGYHPQSVAEFYSAALILLELRPHAVLGASFGGLVSVYLAAEHPTLLSRLVLVSTMISGVELDSDPVADGFRERMLARHKNSEWYSSARRIFDKWTDLALAADHPSTIEEMNAAILPLYMYQPDQPEVRKRLSMLNELMIANLEAMKVWESGLFQRVDARSRAASITSPTLIVCGEFDWVAGPPISKRLQELIPAARLATIPQCGHLPSVEQPEAYARTLDAWLEQ